MSVVDGLRFERNAPEAYVDRFAEIQDLRQKFYERELAGKRTAEEVAHYVGRLTADNWSSPNKAVGKTATEGQRRNLAAVTMAFDERTGEIAGFTYAAENVSSRIERVLAKLHVPEAIKKPIGDFERQKKIDNEHYYVWCSEYVHDPERPELAAVTTGINLSGYNPDLPGTWYPWSQETRLMANLKDWGYFWDGKNIQPIKGENGFGVDTDPTRQWRYHISRIGLAVANISQLPDMTVALSDARASMQ